MFARAAGIGLPGRLAVISLVDADYCERVGVGDQKPVSRTTRRSTTIFTGRSDRPVGLDAAEPNAMVTEKAIRPARAIELRLLEPTRSSTTTAR